MGIESENIRITFHENVDAETVLNAMKRILSRYDQVLVGDLYDLIGLSDQTYVSDWRMGWTSLDEAKIVVKEEKEWILILPIQTMVV